LIRFAEGDGYQPIAFGSLAKSGAGAALLHRQLFASSLNACSSVASVYV
jgi:hypothetical protein